jgi:hypothetical protein
MFEAGSAAFSVTMLVDGSKHPPPQFMRGFTIQVLCHPAGPAHLSSEGDEIVFSEAILRPHFLKELPTLLWVPTRAGVLPLPRLATQVEAFERFPQAAVVQARRGVEAAT